MAPLSHMYESVIAYGSTFKSLTWHAPSILSSDCVVFLL